MPRHEQGRTPDQSEQTGGRREPQLPRERRGKSSTVPPTIHAKEVADTSHEDTPEGYLPLQRRVKEGTRKSDGYSERNKASCKLLGIDGPSSTEMYRFLGDRDIEEPFLFYSQPIDAEEASPVWDGLLSEIEDNSELRIMGILYEDRRLAWATNGVLVHMTHGTLSNVVSVPDDKPKALLTVKKLVDSDNPELKYKAKVIVGRYESDDTIEKGYEYAQLVGDYLGRNLKSEEETTLMEIEVMHDSFKTVFLGTLADYSTREPLSGNNPEGNPKDSGENYL